MQCVTPSTQKQPRRLMRVALAAALFLGGCSAAIAQARPLAPPPPPPVPPAQGPGYSSGPGSPGMPRTGGSKPSGQNPAMQLGPAGRWWDNNTFAKAIGLKQVQQQHMDAVFNANKATLFNTYRTLKTEEAKLDTMQRADSPDEDQILAQTDKVSALRGQLTKASTVLALQLRKELTPEQVQMLESMK